MPASHFENLIKQRMQDIAIQTVTEVKPGQVDRHAVAWGRYDELQNILKMYREAARTDEVETERLA